MKVLLASTSVNADGPMANLAGFHHGYGAAFRELGHDVTSFSHAQVGNGTAALQSESQYDFFLLRDTTVDPDRVAELAMRATRWAMFTHAEFIQSKVIDKRFFARLKELDRMPHYIFLDQQLGDQRLSAIGVDVPMVWLGWGANPATHRSESKDIDILWLGHNYAERQQRVENVIFPLRESNFVVKIHGRGQPDGPLNLQQMFHALARTRILVRISHQAHWAGGYSGRTILDGLASGCYVVHDEFPTCKESFPTGVSFVPVEKVTQQTLRAASMPRPVLAEQADAGYRWVRENKMITHVIQEMLKRVEL